ncbi:MAG: sialate O-acetylesterase [Nocardioides sp.]
MMLVAVLSLSGLFQDHMILQRGRANPIWGGDRPRQTVTLTVEGAPQAVSASTVADEAGRWTLHCPSLPVGGPYRLRITGSSERVLEDVLVGDVWVAAGQSNMQFPLGGVIDAAQELRDAQFPAIRVAKVPQRTAPTPAADVQVEWRAATPRNAVEFSAVAYFFAREIHRAQGVPIGVIDASWGGTRVEAWASAEGLRSVWPAVDTELAHLAAVAPDTPKIQAAYQRTFQQWVATAFPQDTENLGEARGWATIDCDDRAWPHIDLPATVQSAGHADNGIFWFRRDLDLPAESAGRNLVIELGAIDDRDHTYFNGELVGHIGIETPNGHEMLRRYTVPGRLVRAGRNVIAVRVFDHYGLGGFMGPARALLARSGDHVQPLVGPWRWQVERTIPKVPDSVFATLPPLPPEINFPNHPTALFNGMIAPLIPCGLRGFIWYQGESNVGQHDSYQQRFTALIRDWRGRWGQGQLPFYFVQIANFEQNGLWALLREAQTRALAEPETGMAVTIDVGEARDIHPRNKQDVGRRLALLARARAYREPGIVATGPTLARVEIDGAMAHVHWNSATGLRTRDGPSAVLGFELAGADGKFHEAVARIAGEVVTVTSAAVPAPRHVRYAWADSPATNLVNGAGLPAAPFRTDTY